MIKQYRYMTSQPVHEGLSVTLIFKEFVTKLTVIFRLGFDFRTSRFFDGPPLIVKVSVTTWRANYKEWLAKNGSKDFLMKLITTKELQLYVTDLIACGTALQ